MTEERRRVNVLSKFLLMQALNGSALLYLFTILPGFLGSTISWSLNYAGEMDIATNFGLQKLNLDLFSEEEVSFGVALSLSVPINFPVVW